MTEDTVFCCMMPFHLKIFYGGGVRLKNGLKLQLLGQSVCHRLGSSSTLAEPVVREFVKRLLIDMSIQCPQTYNKSLY